jgi:predicted hydrocarbon binding protein
MVDVEFRVVSDQRQGLLLALGQTVIAAGFTLLRQRLLSGADGVVLTMVVRGPQAALLMLEERLGTHHLVRSFEAAPVGTITDGASTPVPAKAPAAAPAQTAVAAVDSRRTEIVLPQLTRDYPNIFIQLVAMERELPRAQRESTLSYLGQRVGAWVYKRDFARGGRLPLADSVRRIVLPAMRQVMQAELHEDMLHIRNSPFCHRGEPGECCHFVRGMLGGLLGGPQGTDDVRVIERQCRNTGAEVCSFEFHA